MEFWNIILQIVGIVFGVISGCWTVYQMIKRDMEKMETDFQKGFQTIFQRMDDKQKVYYETFVKKESYDLEVKYQEILNNNKFVSIQKVFETMFGGLMKDMSEIKESLKELKK